SVWPGELVAIVGPSGSGKSTLLHVIGTLEPPSSGVVRIRGVDAAQLSDRELSLLRAREIGFVFQQFFLVELSVCRESVVPGWCPVDQRPRQTRMLDGQVLADTGPDRAVLVAPLDGVGATGEVP